LRLRTVRDGFLRTGLKRRQGAGAVGQPNRGRQVQALSSVCHERSGEGVPGADTVDRLHFQGIHGQQLSGAKTNSRLSAPGDNEAIHATFSKSLGPGRAPSPDIFRRQTENGMRLAGVYDESVEPCNDPRESLPAAAKD